MKTLVVDDESVSRMKLERIMQEYGECVAVDSGTEALAAFMSAWNSWTPFSLIMLDVSMPGIDGIQTLNSIREAERAKNVDELNRVKIIMVTARSDKDTVTTSIQDGCNDYIIKPFDLGIVHKKLTRLLPELH